MMKKRSRRILSLMLALSMLFSLSAPALAADPTDAVLTLGKFDAATSTFKNATGSSTGNFKSITVGYTLSKADDSESIGLPSVSGFTYQGGISSDYSKVISIDGGKTPAEIATQYISKIVFNGGSAGQEIKITLSEESIEYRTFYWGGNGHFYQYVPFEGTVTNYTWMNAYNTAKGMTYNGRKGYLATVASKEEDLFLFNASTKVGWLGGTRLTHTGTGDWRNWSWNTSDNGGATWYWACGPEAGETFYDTAAITSSTYQTVDARNKGLGYYFNWERGGGTNPGFEPNSGTTETCLATLTLTGGKGYSTGAYVTGYSWNDLKNAQSTKTGNWDSKGFFVEYGDQINGDSSDETGTTTTSSVAAGGAISGEMPDWAKNTGLDKENAFYNGRENELTLQEDVELTAPIVLPPNANVKLNLNGNDLTAPEGQPAIKAEGDTVDLSLVDESEGGGGSVAGGTGKPAIDFGDAGSGSTINVNGKLNINGGNGDSDSIAGGPGIAGGSNTNITIGGAGDNNAPSIAGGGGSGAGPGGAGIAGGAKIDLNSGKSQGGAGGETGAGGAGIAGNRNTIVNLGDGSAPRATAAGGNGGGDAAGGKGVSGTRNITIEDDGERVDAPNSDKLTLVSDKPETAKGVTKDGSISGLDAADDYQYIYRAPGDTEWPEAWVNVDPNSIDGGRLTGLSAGDYKIRQKPATGAEPGEGIEATVAFSMERELSVTHVLSGLSAAENTAGAGKATYWAEYTTTLAALPGYALPETILVQRTMVGGGSAELTRVETLPAYGAAPYAETAEYTYNAATGAITIPRGAVIGDITITAAAGPHINDQPKAASAVAGNAARFTVSATGLGPLTYQWQRQINNTAAWADITGATGSIYTTEAVTAAHNGYQYRCVVKDVNGRLATSTTATLSVVGAPTVNITGILSIDYSASTTLTAAATNGVAPYTYLWSTGETTPSITVSPASTTAYTVTVRDAQGNACTDTETVTVAPPVRTITVTPESKTFAARTAGYAAAPEAETFTIKNTGNAPVGGYTVKASGDGFIVAYTSSTIAKGGESTFTVRPKVGLNAGSYRATVNVTTAEGISADATVDFTVNPPPVVSISGETSVIAGDSVTLAANVVGGAGPYTYAWSTGGTAESITVSPSGTTTYTVTVTDGSGKTATATATVQVQAEHYALEASYAQGETGDFGAKTLGYDPAPAAQTVTVKNTGNRAITLAAPTSTAFAVAPASSLALEPGQSATFTVQPKTGLAAGSHDEALTFAGGGASVSVAARFAVAPALSVSIGGALQIASGSATTLTAYPQGGVEPYAYEWSEAGSAAVVGTATSLSVSAAGTYTVKVTDGEGKVETASVTVTTPGAQPSLSIDKNSLGFGSVETGYAPPEAQLVTVTNTGDAAVSLTGSDISDKTSFTLTATPTDMSAIAPGGSVTFSIRPAAGLPAGIYNGSIIIKANSGEYQRIPVTFTVEAAALLSVSVSGNTSLLTGGNTTVTAIATGGRGEKRYQWYRVEAGGNTAPVDGATTAMLTFGTPKSDNAGSYQYRVIVKDESSPAAQASADVTFTVRPKAYAISLGSATKPFAAKTAGYAAAPDAQEVTITNTGDFEVTNCTVTGGGNAFIVGLTGNKDIASGGTSAFTVQPKAGLFAGAYSEVITVQTKEGPKATFVASFTVNAPPTVSIAGDLSLVAGESTTLAASASGGTGGYTYLWNIGGNNAENVQAPATDTTYTVTATDACGISATASATVTVAPRGYAIGVSPAALDFAKQTAGYAAAPAAQTAIVRNMGEEALMLTEIASGEAQSSFTITVPGGILNTSLAPGQTAAFTVQPNAGLAVGTYREIITVKTDKGASAAVTARFSVASAPAVTISGPSSLGPGEKGRLTAAVTGGTAPFTYLWSTGATGEAIDVTGNVEAAYTVLVTDASGKVAQASLTIPVAAQRTYALSAAPLALRFAASAGYTALPAAQTVTLTNAGNSALTLTQPAGNASFAVGSLSTLTLPAGAQATFTVQPATTGLAAGTYSLDAAVTTDKPGTQAAISARFTVSSPSGDSGDSGGSSSPVVPPASAAPSVPIAPPAPKEEHAPAIEALPQPSASVALDDGGIGKPADMSDAEYAQRLEGILSDIEALLIGHVDAPLSMGGPTEGEIERAETLYQAVWAQSAPDMLHLLDLETGTKTLSGVYDDGRVPVLVTEYVFEGEEYEEALAQVSDGTSIAVIDVSLMLDGVKIQPNGSIEITFSFKEHRDQQLTICHKRQDGAWELFEVTVDAQGYAVITVDSLSPFVIYTAGAAAAPETEQAKPTPSVETVVQKADRPSSAWLWAALLCGCIAAAFFAARRKRGRK